MTKTFTLGDSTSICLDDNNNQVSCSNTFVNNHTIEGNYYLGEFSSNTLNFIGTPITLSNNGKQVYGAYNTLDNTELHHNTVNILSSGWVINNIYGAQAKGNANNNGVNIKADIIMSATSNIYGASSQEGDLKNNYVNIDGGGGNPIEVKTYLINGASGKGNNIFNNSVYINNANVSDKEDGDLLIAGSNNGYGSISNHQQNSLIILNSTISASNGRLAGVYTNGSVNTINNNSLKIIDSTINL